MSDGLKFLASVLANGATGELRDVDQDLFVDGPEHDCYIFISDHFTRHGVLPELSTVNSELQTTLPTRFDVPGYHVGRLRDRRLYNHIRPVFGELREAIKDREFAHIRDLVGRLHTLANTDPAAATAIFNASDIYEAVIERYMADRIHRGLQVVGVPTGWTWLDDQTGGWQQGDIITIAARPELGKTWVLIHCLYNAWAAGKSVLFFTTEMPARQVGSRLIGYQTGINPRSLRTLQLSPWGERRLFAALQAVEADGRLRIIEAAGKSTQWVEDLIHEFQPDLVCIDGVYLLQPSSGRRDAGRFERIGNVFDDINTIKLNTNKPLLVTTQMNRQSGKRGDDGSLETLGYSDAIGTHSSLIFQIKSWPSWATCEVQNFLPHLARTIYCLKGREGPVPPFGIFYDPPRNFDRVATANLTRDTQSDSSRAARRRNTGWMLNGSSD